MRADLLFLFLLVPTTACAMDARRGSGGGDDAFVGAWYGDGPDFADGELCLVLCDNGHAFVADSLCTETSRSDFTGGYYQWSLSGSTLTLASSEEVFMMEARLAGDTLTVDFAEATMPLMRVATEFALCTDPTVPAR